MVILLSSLEMLIYDMDHQRHQSNTVKHEGWCLSKTQDQNKWVTNVWCDWIQYQLWMPCVEKEQNNTNY